MKGLWTAALLVAGAAAFCGPVAGDARAAAPKLQQPAWAYAADLMPAPAVQPDNVKLLSVPGSTRQFTEVQIRAVGDWFPGDHPAMPKLVSEGDPARNIRPCGLCHYPNGKGRPENAGVSGLPKAYFVEQLHDMAAGLRNTAEPLKTNTGLMAAYAKAMTEAEIEATADYFSAMAWTPWIKVVETRTVPKMRSSAGMWVPLKGPDAGMEPIGARLIETPQDAMRSETLRDPRSPFIAYVPVGAVAKGKAIVTSGAGGRTLACATCHGADLNGVGTIPGIAARSPSYIARQLNDFRQGARHGTMAALMAPVVAKLTDDDLLNISAYLASLPAPKPAGS